MALAGGNTPRRMYEMLATRREEAYWDRTHVLWSDERFVPPSDERSNERMARAALLDQVPIPEEQIHPMWNGKSLEEAAAAYESLLESLGEIDLLLLGMGADGHTASLFPWMPEVQDEQRLAVGVVKADGEPRISLAPRTLCSSRHTLVMVSGSDKAQTLRDVLLGPADIDRLPVQIVAREPETLIYADQAAARLVDPSVSPEP